VSHAAAKLLFTPAGQTFVHDYPTFLLQGQYARVAALEAVSVLQAEAARVTRQVGSFAVSHGYFACSKLWLPHTPLGMPASLNELQHLLGDH
jgi:hypothetical protein